MEGKWWDEDEGGKDEYMTKIQTGASLLMRKQRKQRLKYHYRYILTQQTIFLLTRSDRQSFQSWLTLSFWFPAWKMLHSLFGLLQDFQIIFFFSFLILSYEVIQDHRPTADRDTMLFQAFPIYTFCFNGNFH